MYFEQKPYGLDGHLENHGSGANMFRGETFSQPRALSPGDVLASGLEVAGNWQDSGNGGVDIRFADGTRRVVPARVPLLLDGSSQGKLVDDLEIGDIFETGCVVLDEPTPLDPGDTTRILNPRETRVSLTGGLGGHNIPIPSDLVVALHAETYPPSIATKFGAFVVDNVLRMGARARRHLPNYGRLDSQPEPERVAEVLESISRLRADAHSERALQPRTTEFLLKELCEQLRGVELVISGRLHGRGGTVIDSNSPEAHVEDMLVEVFSATVNTYPGHGSLVTRHQPFIEFYGRSIDGDEAIGAWLDVGTFGVSAKIPPS